MELQLENFPELPEFNVDDLDFLLQNSEDNNIYWSSEFETPFTKQFSTFQEHVQETKEETTKGSEFHTEEKKTESEKNPCQNNLCKTFSSPEQIQILNSPRPIYDVPVIPPPTPSSFSVASSPKKRKYISSPDRPILFFHSKSNHEDSFLAFKEEQAKKVIEQKSNPTEKSSYYTPCLFSWKQNAHVFSLFPLEDLTLTNYPLHTLSPLEICLLKSNQQKAEKAYMNWFSSFRDDELNSALLSRFQFVAVNNVYPIITEIIARASLASKIDIHALENRLNHAKVESKHLVLNNLFPRGYVTVYEQGKLKISGFTQIEHGIYLINEATRRLQLAHNSWLAEEKTQHFDDYLKHFHFIETYHDFFIEQIRATLNFFFKIQLSSLYHYFEPELQKEIKVYRHHEKDEIDYEEGDFYKFNYKYYLEQRQEVDLHKNFLTIKVFHTGKLQFSSAKHPEEIQASCNYLIPILFQFFQK